MQTLSTADERAIEDALRRLAEQIESTTAQIKIHVVTMNAAMVRTEESIERLYARVVAMDARLAENAPSKSVPRIAEFWRAALEFFGSFRKTQAEKA